MNPKLLETEDGGRRNGGSKYGGMLDCRGASRQQEPDCIFQMAHAGCKGFVWEGTIQGARRDTRGGDTIQGRMM